MTPEQMSQVGAVLSTPIGLALPESNKDAKKFNLLPPEAIKRAKLKKVQERTLIGAVALIVLLAGFGVYRYFQVRSAQNNVNSLQSSINTLNAEIPKYDLVVKANDAFEQGKVRRAAVLNTSVDWPTALANLINITPANLKVQAFSGTTTSATTPSSTPSASASAGPSVAAIGTVSTSVTGPGPAVNSLNAWTQAISGDPAKLFANPVATPLVTNTDGTVSFPSTISVTAFASLAKDASLQ